MSIWIDPAITLHKDGVNEGTALTCLSQSTRTTLRLLIHSEEVGGFTCKNKVCFEGIVLII